RIDRLIAVGLVGQDWKTPFGAAPSAPRTPALAQVSALCAAGDAPAWIVAPIAPGAAPDLTLKNRSWTARQPYELDLAGRWFVTRTYAVIPCVGR
ncbi:MAG: hypothetical protein B7X77_12705, partial [Caulobacter sp. 39-67-4]